MSHLNATDDSSASWTTPDWLYARLNDEFGFTLDAAADPRNTKCERFFTRTDDALAQSWEGVVFCNPPYGVGLENWVAKARVEAWRGATVVMVIPTRTDRGFWHNHVMTGEVRYIRGRLRYGDGEGAAPFASAVVIFRPSDPRQPTGRSYGELW